MVGDVKGCGTQRILFLDVDGVLNTSTLRFDDVHALVPCGAPFPIDRRLLCRLREVLHATQACVVLSSAWRLDVAPRHALLAACVSVGISHRVFVSQTCEIHRTNGVGRTGTAACRVQEIARWLQHNSKDLGVQHWAAIDDMDLAKAWPEASTHIVRTNPTVGIAVPDAKELLEILGTPFPNRIAPSRGAPVVARKVLVLDVDGTLIDSLPIKHAHTLGSQAISIQAQDCCVVSRPHLQEFLDFCFSHFDGVGIWNDSSDEWMQSVIHVLGRQRPWAFIWSRKRCATSRAANFQSKPLRKLWRIKRLRALGFCSKGTLIVEDVPAHCGRNHGNAVYVPKFSALACWNPGCKTMDDGGVLARLTRFLKDAVLPSPDVRNSTRAHLDDGWLHADLGNGETSSDLLCPVCDGTNVISGDQCPLCGD